MPDVREALHTELESRGFDVADDTVASRNALYVKGAGDLAAALFEFKPSVRDAVDTMYQGHWTEGLPPRIAVLPSDAASDPNFELLEQMRVVPLLYEVTGEAVAFPGLDAVIQLLRR